MAAMNLSLLYNDLIYFLPPSVNYYQFCTQSPRPRSETLQINSCDLIIVVVSKPFSHQTN